MQTTAIVKQRNGVFFLVGLSALGWLLIFWSSENMSSPVVSMMMPMDVNWGLSEIVAVWIMWAVMMGAMMLPSAMPMLVVHRRVAAKRDPGATNSNTWFLIGYVLTWTLFSAVAAAAQWGFQRGGMLSPMLRLQDQSIAGG
ncbi:DUF2182 domain-containing protein, partial [uncultured Boseongicola sp.]|uniref:copper chaperone n=1 Tax=uncultured Boseongicola sp. TaxID=1648499 RepID=UPI00261D32B7